MPGILRAHPHAGTPLTATYPWELFGLPEQAGPVIVALAVTAMAVGCFLGAEKLEKALAGRADPVARATPAGRPGRLVFAGFAAVVLVGLAGLAIPFRKPGEGPRGGSIGPLDLARRVFDEPWKLRVIDLRPTEACAAKRIPGSECLPPEELGKLGLADAEEDPVDEERQGRRLAQDGEQPVQAGRVANGDLDGGGRAGVSHPRESGGQRSSGVAAPSNGSMAARISSQDSPSFSASSFETVKVAM